MQKNPKHAIFSLSVFIVLSTVLSLCIDLDNEDTNKSLPIGTVSFALDNSTYLNFSCEIAQTYEDRAKGLMHREHLPSDRGMLFVYDQGQDLTYWMKNTKIPLDIIFIDENRSVLNVEKADVEQGVLDNDLTKYHSDGPAKWVLEINQGLSESYGIKSGTPVNMEYLNTTH